MEKKMETAIEGLGLSYRGYMRACPKNGASNGN